MPFMQVYVYCCTPRLDSKSAHLRNTTEAAGCVWRSVVSLEERELADLIRSDRIDVLIELTGVTPALPPAPTAALIM
jgi:protein O-GlcNAc transferase